VVRPTSEPTLAVLVMIASRLGRRRVLYRIKAQMSVGTNMASETMTSSRFVCNQRKEECSVHCAAMKSATLDLNTIVQWLRNQEMNTTRKDNYQTCRASTCEYGTAHGRVHTVGQRQALIQKAPIDNACEMQVNVTKKQ
jgi:hypothetical protein